MPKHKPKPKKRIGQKGSRGEHAKMRFDMFKPDEQLQDFYCFANKEYFGYKLPFVQVGWNKDPKDKDDYGCTLLVTGAAFPHYIFINARLKRWPSIVYLTILHEMIHVKFGNRYGHGRKFKQERMRLAKLGAFNEHI